MRLIVILDAPAPALADVASGRIIVPYISSEEARAELKKRRYQKRPRRDLVTCQHCHRFVDRRYRIYGRLVCRKCHKVLELELAMEPAHSGTNGRG